jgi:hypothetical protein
MEARKNAYRAIIHTKPPNMNDIFLATQVSAKCLNPNLQNCQHAIVIVICNISFRELSKFLKELS